MQHIDRRNSL